jgi:hypothetical protein
MPTATDLVTDLPADFEVFGQAVATSMADLLGGTTGQILSKATNTDMDFTWITNDVGDITAVTVTSPITGGGTSGSVGIAIQDGTTAQKGAVQLENSTASTSTTTAAVPASVKSAYDLADAAISKTIVDAKGDLIGATAADTPARLAVGSNYGFLQADSAAAIGLSWNSGAWTTYTPTVTATTGSFTTVSATGRWIRVGKLAVVQFSVTITTNGTAAGQVVVTAPFGALASSTYMGVVRESNATGNMGFAAISSGGGTSFYCANYDNTYMGGTGRLISGTISYEVA